jgi:hypothetical protein
VFASVKKSVRKILKDQKNSGEVVLNQWVGEFGCVVVFLQQLILYKPPPPTNGDDGSC